MKKNFTVSDFIIEFLSKEKVKHIFLLPGGGNMFLIDAVAKSKKVKGIPFHHEHAISIAAEAYSRISNNIGVAIVTTGPGSTNAITGLLGSWIESVPLIIISGQVKTSDIKKRLKLRQQGVQGVNITKIVNSITKFSFTLKKTSNFENILKKSITTAKENRGGPVWIDVPLDVQGTPLSLEDLPAWKENSNIKNKAKEIPDHVIKDIQDLISNAKRPLILAGHGIRLANAAESFKVWVEELGVPVVSTWNALDLLPFNHPLYVGRPGVVALRGPNFAVQNCDVLISIGCRLDNIITAYNSKGFARDAKKIVIDVDLNEINKMNILIEEGIIILHRHKRSNDSFDSKFKILRTENYGISKIIFGKFI